MSSAEGREFRMVWEARVKSLLSHIQASPSWVRTTPLECQLGCRALGAIHTNKIKFSLTFDEVHFLWPKYFTGKFLSCWPGLSLLQLWRGWSITSSCSATPRTSPAASLSLSGRHSHSSASDNSIRGALSCPAGCFPWSLVLLSNQHTALLINSYPLNTGK